MYGTNYYKDLEPKKITFKVSYLFTPTFLSERCVRNIINSILVSITYSKLKTKKISAFG